MNTLIRNIVKYTYQPLLVKYLSATRQYRYGKLILEVPPEVFHPGFFTSTGYLLHHVMQMDLKNMTLLVLGAGSGIVGIASAKQGAIVTAIDINPVAVQCITANMRRNQVSIQIFESDLFDALPSGSFDVIAVNPPYYSKDPLSMKEHAWYCGSNGQYFRKLFQQVPEYMHENTQVLMTLCDGADLEMIRQHALEGGCMLNCIHQKQHFLQKNFLYSITLC